MDDRRIEVNGTSLNVVDRGRGTPILLLHGNGSRARHWQPQIDALSDRWRVIAPDQRGFGASAPLDRAPSLGLYADDAAQLLAALGLDDAVVVGLSLGGLVAQSLAIRHREVVARLVLAGCPTLETATEGPRPPTIDGAVVAALVDAAFSDRFHREHPETVAAVVADATTAEVVATVAAWRDAPSAAAEGLATEAVDVDTLVIGGSADALCPPEAVDELAAAIARSTRATLDGAGHLMNLERPGEFNELVSTFAV